MKRKGAPATGKSEVVPLTRLLWHLVVPLYSLIDWQVSGGHLSRRGGGGWGGETWTRGGRGAPGDLNETKVLLMPIVLGVYIFVASCIVFN